MMTGGTPRYGNPHVPRVSRMLLICAFPSELFLFSPLILNLDILCIYVWICLDLCGFHEVCGNLKGFRWNFVDSIYICIYICIYIYVYKIIHIYICIYILYYIYIIYVYCVYIRYHIIYIYICIHLEMFSHNNKARI